MTSPFDGRGPFDTDEQRARLAARQRVKAEGREITYCTGCGDPCADHGDERPRCEACDRRYFYGGVVDGVIEFFFGGTRRRRRE